MDVRVYGRAWTPERVDLLVKLWDDGLSCSQIAKELEGVTRNSVIGKASRLGLPARVASKNRAPFWGKQEDNPKPKRKRKKVLRLVVPVKRPTMSKQDDPLPPPQISDADIPLWQRRTQESLRRGDCKWPVGDPGDKDFFYCGAPAVTDKPYCAAHCARAYLPARSYPRSAFVFMPKKVA